MLLVAPVHEKRRTALSADERQILAEDRDFPRRAAIVRSEIPAVTHVDYSARVQTIDAARNPRLHNLLTAFQRRTGCPVLINTSFNVRGEPIVCTPKDALRCFQATEMDALVMEDVVVYKTQQALPAAAALRDNHLAQFQLD
jgi:carbamoyltransferase